MGNQQTHGGEGEMLNLVPQFSVSLSVSLSLPLSPSPFTFRWAQQGSEMGIGRFQIQVAVQHRHGVYARGILTHLKLLATKQYLQGIWHMYRKLNVCALKSPERGLVSFCWWWKMRFFVSLANHSIMISDDVFRSK